MRAALEDLAGTQISPTAWLRIDQAMVDAFAAVTGDRQWIHVDRERARTGPFGTTVAHGFLTLALLPRFWHQAAQIRNYRTAVNYGLNRVRFPAPLLVPSRIRAHFRIDGVKQNEGAKTISLHATIEREGADRPVCIADALFRYYE